jgi:hypothetical protein
MDDLPCLSSFLRIHRASKGTLVLPVPFFDIEFLEQGLVNEARSKLQNRADVRAKKMMVRIPAAIIKLALPSLRWEKPLPTENKRLNAVCFFSITISSFVLILNSRT